MPLQPGGIFFGVLLNLKLNFAANKHMNSKIKLLIGLFVLSSLLVLAGALAKIQHCEALKPLMLAGLLLQTIVIGYALVIFVLRKKIN